MSNSKFTPGPWHAALYEDDQQKFFKIHDTPSGPGQFGPLAYPIARTYFEMPVDEANARLIAAAPDMLEALERVSELLDNIDADRLSKAEFANLEEIDEILGKAIRRAKGES